MHGPSQCGHQYGSAAGQLRSPRQLLCETAPVDELHREIRPPLEAAHVVDLHDMRMLQFSHGLRFAHKSRHFLRAGIWPGHQHLQSHDPIELSMSGSINDAHTAATEDVLDVITLDLR